ncbi:DYH17 protein, partial [Nothocercus julius]|nr:DYH17 protein [Nothocercus julius]
SMFEPLKETIALLKTYGEEMPEEIHQQLHVGGGGRARGRAPCRVLSAASLQDLPEQWNNTKKLSFQVKQNVAPLQANEVNILRRKCQ